MSASREGGPSAIRRRRSTPWGGKRRRLVCILVILALCFLPGLIWRARLGTEVRSQLEALRVLGRPTTLVAVNEMGGPAAPDGHGRETFLEAAQAYQDMPGEQWPLLPFRGDLRLTPGTPIPTPIRAAMESYVSSNEAPLRLLQAVAQQGAWRHIDVYEPLAWNINTEHLRASQRLCALLCCQAILAGERGDGAGALLALYDALSLARSLESDGLYVSLARQWELEGDILEALKWLMGQIAFNASDLEPFQAQFNLAHRVSQWQRMCDVEQGLFLARLEHGANHGLIRNGLLAMGVGDLNVRAYLAMMSDVRAGFGISEAEQQPLINHHQRVVRGLRKYRIMYATVLSSLPPSHFDYMRDQADEAIVAEIALAACAYRGGHGIYPNGLADLVPDFMEQPPGPLSDGATLNYRTEVDGFRLWRGEEGGDEEAYWVVMTTPVAP